MKEFLAAVSMLVFGWMPVQAQVPDHASGEPYVAITPYLWMSSVDVTGAGTSRHQFLARFR